jgi:hypothetical protein
MKAIDSPERIALWVSRQGSDTVASWALCAWRLLRYPSQPNLDLVLVGSPAGQEDPVGLGSGSVRVTPADARRGLDQACSLSLTQVRRMARSWRKLSDRSPILAKEVGDVVRKDKPLLELGTYQASFFPRLEAGHLVLSRFDELLFACLEDRGSTPADVFLARGAAGEELRRRWLAVTGDVFLSIRLAQWATHRGGDAALIRETHRADNVMLAARYRLSEAGHAIQRDGLGTIDRGAPLPLWGTVAYDPLTPWAAVDGQEAMGVAPVTPAPGSPPRPERRRPGPRRQRSIPR